MRIYLDISPIIYMVEKVMPFCAAVEARLSVPGLVLISSELTRLECLVAPMRTGNTALVTDFDTFFADQVSELVPFTAAVFRQATEIRARHGFKTPDALHLAAAIEGGCQVFLTNDAQLTRFPDLTVEVV